jgi:D-alanyl-D-alanine carboxypeptidase
MVILFSKISGAVKMFNKVYFKAIFLTFLFAAIVIPSFAIANDNIRREKSVILMDAETGNIIYQEQAFENRYPASLTKMMTIFITLYAIENTSLTENTMLKVSKNAASKPATNLQLKEGDRISVSDAIKSLVVHSANDVATVIAETLGGSEEKFANMMTHMAKKLGMKKTNFVNASGLPDKKQLSSAFDMAILARALQKYFPQHYHYFGNSEFSWNGKKYTSHNKMLTSYPGIDGLKTGYIRDSGFHLATSYRSPKTGRKLIAIYMGAERPKERRDILTKLLDSSENGSLGKFALNRNGSYYRTYASR